MVRQAKKVKVVATKVQIHALTLPWLGNKNEGNSRIYSVRKMKHCNKNVVIVNTRGKRIDYLSQTYPGKTRAKKIADAEGISYPPGATLYKDTGFQGDEPAVKKTCQAKKKATPRGAHRG